MQGDADVAPGPWPRTTPAGAGVHDAAPAVLLNVPAAHGAADVAPDPAVYEPAGAGVQDVAPAVLLNDPSAHGVADVLPVPET